MIDPIAAPLRILVVDDNEAVTKTMGWLLEALGHQVRTANDGFGALAVARSFRPHVLLLDISLPGMDGYEVCRRLRTEPEFAKSLFIAQSGWGQAEHRVRSEEAGFHHYLVKPIDTTMLEGLLATHERLAVA